MKPILTVVLIFHLSIAYTQETGVTDTLELARTKAYAGQLAEAETLLAHYTTTNKNPGAYRLHGQVLYWMKRFNDADAVLQQAVSLFPDEPLFMFEYGRFLFNIGRFRPAEDFLLQYKSKDSLHTETNLLLARMWYWQGRFKESNRVLNQLLQTYPEQADALALQSEIKQARSFYLRLNSGYLSDDQPLSAFQNKLETGAWRSAWFTPKLSIETQNFLVDQQPYNTIWLQAGNTLSSGKTGTSLSLTGGLFNAATADTAAFTGEVKLTQKAGIVTASAFLARKPYLLTMAAAKDPVMQTVYGASVEINKKYKWMGKLLYEQQVFNDAEIYTAYAWGMMPLIFNRKYWLHIGYSFSWQNASVNSAGYKEPLPPLAAIYNNGLQIQTVYAPYFTPDNQFIHSALFSTKLFLSAKAALQVRGSMGLSAKADIPYFYVDYNPPQYNLQKDYTRYSFRPYEVVAGLEIKPSQRFQFQLNYQFQSVLFYQQHLGTIQLNYQFSHDSK